MAETLKEEILTSILIVVVLLSHFMSSVLLCALLPLTILMTFILMHLFQIDANIMSLVGIAIAIGEMVDMGIIFCENIVSRVEEEDAYEDPTGNRVPIGDRGRKRGFDRHGHDHRLIPSRFSP